MGKFSKVVAGLGIGAAALGVVGALFSGKADDERIREAVDEYFEEYDEDEETSDTTDNSET